jgi:hypothetical protein
MKDEAEEKAEKCRKNFGLSLSYFILHDFAELQ